MKMVTVIKYKTTEYIFKMNKTNTLFISLY